MARLEDFTQEERNLLEALPYRAGLWVSVSDTTGGGEADDAEARALESIVTGFAEDFCKSEFVQMMMEETIARKDDWPSWGDDLDSVPKECEKAIALLTGRLDRKEITSFKLSIMEIATAVALAYREFDHHEDLSYRLKVYGRLLKEKLRLLLTGQGISHSADFLNISESEQRALDILSRSLDISGYDPRSGSGAPLSDETGTR